MKLLIMPTKTECGSISAQNVIACHGNTRSQIVVVVAAVVFTIIIDMIFTI